MPQLFRVGPYMVYFWANEGSPLEPVHVHVAERAMPNATKLWITSCGKCILCNNNSQIPAHVLRNIMRLVEAQSSTIVRRWLSFFGQISYYC